MGIHLRDSRLQTAAHFLAVPGEFPTDANGKKVVKAVIVRFETLHRLQQTKLFRQIFTLVRRRETPGADILI